MLFGLVVHSVKAIAGFIFNNHRLPEKEMCFYCTKQICCHGLGDRNSVRLSLRLSDTYVLCDETKEDTADILIANERIITLGPFWGSGRPSPPLKTSVVCSVDGNLTTYKH